MKRVLIITMVMLAAAMGLFAAVGTASGTNDSAKVKLDLDVEKFVIGFANSEATAKTFTPYTSDYLMASTYNTDAEGSTPKALVTTSQYTPMYFFYDCAMKRANTYKLTAEIARPLTQQNDTDTGNATGTPDTINYTATITGGIANSAFEDGTWVTAASSLGTLKSSNITTSKDPDSGETTTTPASIDVLANLRGGATAPYTVVYASAMKIALSIDDGQHLEAKKSAVYRSEIKFTIVTTA